MVLNGLKKVSAQVGRTLVRNSPTLLTGLGVAGFVTTVIMAVQATPKALTLIDHEVFERYEASLEEKEESYLEYLDCPEGYDIYSRIKMLPAKDIIQLTWRCYLPTAIMGAVSIACVICANSINLRRNAALASVYSLTEAALKEYQKKVVEIVGENKAARIKDEIHKDKVAKSPVCNTEVIITGRGETLCYDVISSRYFKSDIEGIRKIQNDLNAELITDMWLSLNDVYYELGLTGIKIGDELGWDIQNGLIEFRFSSQLTEGGVPCLVVDYVEEPRYKFRDY